MGLTFITREEFNILEEEYPYYKDRWKYFSKVINKIKRLDVSSVLELGPGPSGKSIVHEADTIGLKNCQITHDATVLPWPIKKRYDLFIALQVFEHLKGKQREVFDEVKRIADRAIITVPYMWRKKSHRINWKTLRKWFGCECFDVIEVTEYPIRYMFYFEFNGNE